MKHVKLAHPSQCREIPENELDRLLAQGWVEIKKQVNANARKQRQFRQRQKLTGYRRFAVYLSDAEFQELIAAKLTGETFAQLLIRLLRCGNRKGQEDGDELGN